MMKVSFTSSLSISNRKEKGRNTVLALNKMAIQLLDLFVTSSYCIHQGIFPLILFTMKGLSHDYS